MTSMWMPGRAAERFDRAVDPGAPAGTVTGTPEDLLDLVAAIRALPEVQPRPEHTRALRGRLMAEADRLAAARAVPVPAPDPQEERLRLRPRGERSRRRRITVAAGTLAVLGVGASVGVAAQTALPGESLYGVKRALEAAQAGATPDEAARGELLLTNASDRLAETLAVLEGSDPAATSQLSATLDSFSSQAAEASTLLLGEYARSGDRALVEELRTFTASSSVDLTAMRPDMPASGREAWQRANDAVAVIDTDALTACPLCAADLGSLGGLASARTPDFSSGRDRPGAGTQTPRGAQSGGGDARPDGTTPPNAGQGTGGEDRGRPDGDVATGGSALSPSPSPTPSPRTPRTPDPDLPDSGGLGDTARDLTGGVTGGLRGGLGGGGDRGQGDRSGPKRGDGSGDGSGSNSGGGSGGGSGLELPGTLDDLLP